MKIKVAASSTVCVLALAFTAGCVDSSDQTDLIAETEQELAVVSTSLWFPSITAGTLGKTFVPVCFTNGTAAQQSAVRSAVEGGWEALGAGTNYGVDFTNWGACPASSTGTVRVTFGDTGNSTSPLGRFVESMSLQNTPIPTDVILHEFGHALGFAHEYRRPDFDHTNCPPNNGTYPDLAINGVDYSSVMNFYDCRPHTLSFGDRDGFRKLYGPYEVRYSSKFAMRVDGTIGTFARGDATPDVELGKVTEEHEFLLEFVSGPSGGSGLVQYGDKVRLRTSSGGYLRSGTTDNSLVSMGGGRDVASEWELLGGTGVVNVNDRVRFTGLDRLFISRSASKRLIMSRYLTYFRFIALGSAINW